MSHRGDSHWEQIWCRECHDLVGEYYEKGYASRQDDICDDCSRKETTNKNNEYLIDKLKEKLCYFIKKYEPKRCYVCGKVLDPNPKDPLNPYEDNQYERCRECPAWGFSSGSSSSPYDDD